MWWFVIRATWYNGTLIFISESKLKMIWRSWLCWNLARVRLVSVCKIILCWLIMTMFANVDDEIVLRQSLVRGCVPDRWTAKIGNGWNNIYVSGAVRTVIGTGICYLDSIWYTLIGSCFQEVPYLCSCSVWRPCKGHMEHSKQCNRCAAAVFSRSGSVLCSRGVCDDNAIVANHKVTFDLTKN